MYHRLTLEASLTRLASLQRTEVLAQFAALPAAALLTTDVAARGLDIPDVHWVFQLDAPQNPANFVHRCGRTARMGRAGRALCLLLPHEDCYVELLARRNIPMTRRPSASLRAPPADVPPAAAREGADVAAVAAASAAAAADVPACARRLAEMDRDVMEKATKAFVAYVRGYKEHHCKFIFQLGDLDLSHLGRMFGILRLPVMKEVGCAACLLLRAADEW
jgi:ATP-dependent RNA helicase DDX55/SPB4